MDGVAGGSNAGRGAGSVPSFRQFAPAAWPAGQGPCAAEEPADQGPAKRRPTFSSSSAVFGNGPICTAYAEAVALQRTNTRSQPLFLDRGGQTVLLDSKDMNFPVETGLQVGVIRHGCCGWDLEAAYFQIDGWAVDRRVTGLSQMVTDVNGGNFYVNDAQARYTSQLHLGELNLRREWFDGLTLLAGFRMGELDELYSAGGAGLVRRRRSTCTPRPSTTCMDSRSAPIGSFTTWAAR